MSERRTSTARRLLHVFADDGALPGLTLGTIEERAGLARGTATHQRISDLRSYGWDIRCDRVENRYYALHRERARMKRHLAQLAASHTRNAKVRGAVA
jgi:hypothetical protein